ncbi:hypothetical protein ACHAW5_006709 [Stephanodiscus triporus]|uniref:Haem-binding uptake Tiki superfamily ChaN domain-containing protein n=1 Tax=Stephanodiscus triporus TaxID=2934178 RepID=A0ABD3MX56_9STRA
MMPPRSSSLLASLLVVLTAVDAFAPPRLSQELRRSQQHHRVDVDVDFVVVVVVESSSSLYSKDDRRGNIDSYHLSPPPEDGGMPAPPSWPTTTTTVSRRSVLRRSAASVAALGGVGLLPVSSASALPPIASFSNPFGSRLASMSNGGSYVPARRCTAYLVDSTIPPSLIPYRASREAAILKGLGMGKGTPKGPVVEDDVNLNNFMNRAVFGSLDAAKRVVGMTTGDDGSTSSSRSGANYQSFVFLGANFDDTHTASPERVAGETNADATLAVGLLADICRPRERSGNTAIGLAFAPRSAQDALDYYLLSKGEEDATTTMSSLDEYDVERKVVETLIALGADGVLAERHLPILRFAKRRGCALLALAPEPSDLRVVRGGGLQSLDPTRRGTYVADAPGFIALTQEPKFKLYTDKSLLKDFVASSSPTAKDEASTKAEQGNFFAERILVHEACATAIARWATSRPDSLVVTIAPVADVRFLGGINGRVPRVCKYLNPESLVDDEAVTTILLNPSAEETLSESKWLRLEIGTAPNNWTYQSKIADYLWFSSMPKVNMLPRMMNEQ